MSAPELVSQPKPSIALKHNQSMIAGRIDSVRRFENNGKPSFEHRVIQPAADSFSSPGAVMVRCSYKLGNVGEDITAHVSVFGYRDKFTDKGTGEVVQTARNTLAVIE